MKADTLHELRSLFRGFTGGDIRRTTDGVHPDERLARRVRFLVD